MNHLVCSNVSTARSRHLYKSNDGHLVRTPIIKRLNPDQWKIYQVFPPAAVGTGGYATGGWQGGNTYSTTVTSVCYQMVYDMIYANHQWLDAAGAHDPEMVWYQGAYATGASTINQGKFMSEAFASFPAFHFTIPSVDRKSVV